MVRRRAVEGRKWIGGREIKGIGRFVRCNPCCVLGLLAFSFTRLKLRGRRSLPLLRLDNAYQPPPGRLQFIALAPHQPPDGRFPDPPAEVFAASPIAASRTSSSVVHGSNG